MTDSSSSAGSGTAAPATVPPAPASTDTQSGWVKFRNGIAAKVKGIWDSLRGQIVDMLSGGLNAVIHEIEAQAPNFEGDIVAAVKTSASDAVKAADLAGGDGKARAALALSTFLAEMLAKGVVITENSAEIIIKAVYADLKALKVIS